MDENSSIGSIQSETKESAFIGSLESESNVALTTNLGSFIKWNCRVNNRKVLLSEIKQLIMNPPFINVKNRYEQYSKELMSILENMFKRARLRPLEWFKCIDFDSYAQQFHLTEQELHAEINKLSRSINGCEWDINDINALYSHICGNAPDVDTHNLKVAFKKFKLSVKKIDRLNKAGSLLGRIGMFLAKHNLNIENFTLRKMELGFKDVDSMVSQLLYTYMHARNTHSTTQSVVNRVGDTLIGNMHSDNVSMMSDESGNSFVSALSHRRQLLGHTEETPFKCGLAPRPVLSNNLGKDNQYSTSVLYLPLKETIDLRPWRKGKHHSAPVTITETNISGKKRGDGPYLPAFNHETYMKAILINYNDIVSQYDNRLKIAKKVMRASVL